MYRYIWGDGACTCDIFFWRGGDGRTSRGLGVFELAADKREATLGKGARYTLTGVLTSC
jgi:hypothetical protein